MLFPRILADPRIVAGAEKGGCPVTDPYPMKPKMVATDVDGTLLDPAERISPRTRDAVAALVADGVPFVLATGRPPRWIPPVVQQLGYAPLCVCGNGAIVYDSAADRILQAAVMDAATVAWVAEVAQQVLPGCGLAVERAEETVGHQFLSTSGYRHVWPNPDDTVVSHTEVVGGSAMKLLIRCEGATSAAMVARLAPRLGGRVDLTYSTDLGLVEVSAPGVSKASAVAAIAERFGVQTTTIMAFGDMPNDVPMLRLAGHGVAMENAHPEVLAAADEVTGSNEADGVAAVLQRWWTC